MVSSFFYYYWGIVAIIILPSLSEGFVSPIITTVPRCRNEEFHQLSLAKRKKPNTNINPNQKQAEDNDDGEVGQGPNWIERSFPVDLGQDDGGLKELKKVEDYNLGISGISFQTGQLSKRMYDAIISRSQFGSNPSEEIQQALTLYAMDFTAKEATKAALLENGLQIALMEEEEDEGMWGDIDTIRIVDSETGMAMPGIYDSTQDAITEGGWKPGMTFDFVVRQVPAKLKELSLEEMLQALDPDGTLREEAKNSKNSDKFVRAWEEEGENLNTLEDLANDNIQRTENSPRGATTEDEAFSGISGKRGYTPINLSDLLSSTQDDGSENEKTVMHVMNAMVSHGALLVDMTNGGTTMEYAKQLATMWEGIEEFYAKVDRDESVSTKLPPMTTVMETGSQTAKVGYASYDNGSLQFLETRRNRNTGELLPVEANEILGSDTVNALGEAFNAVTSAGKAAVRIAVAASTMEAEVLDDVEASAAAALMADELLDDGSSFDESTEYPVCMSPHRLCRYSDKRAQGQNAEDGFSNSREVFGAHVDSTWVTIVPVAAVSGLEVLDETEVKWYRPELAAKRHFEESGSGSDDADLPWYSRYVVLMPGELLQLATRNEIPAAVHRVVATQNAPSRLSAPILFRCRPGVKMDVARYLGDSGGYPLLKQCDGMTIEEIHAALQPTSFQ